MMRRLCLFFFIVLTMVKGLETNAAFLSASASSDTLHVAQAYLDGPHRLRLPFSTDSVNLKGNAFDPQEVLKNNASLALRRFSAFPTVAYGAALDSNSVSALHFSLDTECWRKLKLDAKSMARYDIYLNGVKQQGGELRLNPGRSVVALLIYSEKTARDTFKVSLIGEHLKGVIINSTEKRKLLLDDLNHGERYYGMKMSPSGRYLISYYYTTQHDGAASYKTMLTDLNTNRTLYNHDGYEHVDWLPQRDALYFTRNTDIGKQLVTLNPATMQETILGTGLPSGSYEIAPNEQFLIVFKDEEGPTSQGALRQLIEPDDCQPGWRNRSSLFLYDLKSGMMQRLTFGKNNMHLSEISHDSRKLLLMQSRMELTKQPLSYTNVYEMDLATGRIDTLLVDQPWLSSACYSPNDKQVLFKGTPAAFNGIGSEVKAGQHPQGYDMRLFLYDIATQKTTPLLRNFAPSVNDVAWHTADGFIYFECTDGYDETLWRLDPRTGERFRFNLPVSVIQHYGIANTKNPRMVFYGQTGTTSRNAYLTHLSGATPKCTPWGHLSFKQLFGDTRVASCHPWKFTTSRGDQVEGFYYLPADFDQSKRYPMIVYYYGGCSPTTRVLEFVYPFSALANMGYVVLVLEPSGTIGFGQEFAARHVNAWGDMTADDIIEGTRTFCAENTYVDAKKVGCMGASYGGFMTQYLQTKTDLFAAAISHAGISNIASYWGGGYWGYTYGEVAQYGSYPWNNPDLYVKHSPLFNADKIHTPILFLHGTADTNVPNTESQQLYTALRLLGRPTSYIQVEGENHHVVDYHKRKQWQAAIMAWFAKYLQGDDAWWKDLGFE